MNEQLNRLENKIDKLDERLDSINITLAAQHVCLEDHIKRTALLENEVGPLKSFMNQIMGVGKFIGILSLIFSILAIIYKLK